MKQYFVIFLFLVIAVSAGAQQKDSVLVRPPTAGSQPNVIHSYGVVTDGFNYWEDSFTGHWSGVYFGLNGFLNDDYSNYPADDAGFMDVNLLRSTVLDLNLIKYSIGLQRTRNTIGLVTGLGLELQTYFLDRKTSIEKGFSKVEPKMLFFDSNQKSKFSSAYLNIPLLAEFQIPVENYGDRFYVSAGVVAGIRLSTHTKVKYRANGKKEKLKTPDDYYLQDVRFSGMLRMGYRWVNVFASYDIQPLFLDDKGPELYPFSFGIALFSF